MAKLKAPLFSLGAQGSVGKSLVFFGWKGIDVVRSHVVPANPQTAPQTTQRGYLTQIVDDIHAAQAHATSPLVAIDVTAYALYGSTLGKVMTWFNAICKQAIDQLVAGKKYCLYTDATVTPGVDQVVMHLEIVKQTGAANGVTAGTWYYGTSPTALVNTKAATIAGTNIDDTFAALVTGTKYFFQFRSTAHDDFDGTQSGIYYGTPT